MIYITGDTYADFSRFEDDKFPIQSDMTKNDYVIICGDCGFTWDWSGETRWWTKWYNEKPWTTLCVAGN